MALKPCDDGAAAVHAYKDPQPVSGDEKSTSYAGSTDGIASFAGDISLAGDTSEKSPSPHYDVTILICSTCRPPDGCDARPTLGETLAAAVHSKHDQGDDVRGITVASVECLGNCKRRLSAALVTPGCWSYIFGDLGVENAADLVEGARLMRTTSNGLMPWRGRPQCLKSGMVARIPPLNSPLLK